MTDFAFAFVLIRESRMFTFIFVLTRESNVHIEIGTAMTSPVSSASHNICNYASGSCPRMRIAVGSWQDLAKCPLSTALRNSVFRRNVVPVVV